ncbi:hypothetical protein PF011_g31330 [Phytophthora fragariae]|uniref:Uncharacterized protein n=1 Tax=Phytophthora fragariae TaxID=53985 RepID=A0A6A3GKR0_9STRA|nr:hypothetical protein PF011_g31330 [Phytophthora fragariae]
MASNSPTNEVQQSQPAQACCLVILTGIAATRQLSARKHADGVGSRGVHGLHSPMRRAVAVGPQAAAGPAAREVEGARARRGCAKRRLSRDLRLVNLRKIMLKVVGLLAST